MSSESGPSSFLVAKRSVGLPDEIIHETPSLDAATSHAHECYRGLSILDGKTSVVVIELKADGSAMNRVIFDRVLDALRKYT